MKTHNTTRQALVLALIAIFLMALTGPASAGTHKETLGSKNLGLEFTADLSPVKTSTMLGETLTGDGAALVLSRRYSFAKGQLAASVTLNKGAEASGYVKLFGKTVTSFKKAYSASTSFSTPLYTKSTTFGDYRFAIAGFPVHLSLQGGVTSSIDGSVAFQPGTAGGTASGVSFKCGPQASANVSGAAAVGIKVLEAGVEGTVTLGKAAINAVLAATFPATKHAQLNWGADLVTTSPSGKFSGYVKVSIKLFFIRLKKTFRATIWKFDGHDHTTPLEKGVISA